MGWASSPGVTVCRPGTPPLVPAKGPIRELPSVESNEVNALRTFCLPSMVGKKDHNPTSAASVAQTYLLVS